MISFFSVFDVALVIIVASTEEKIMELVVHEN